MEEKLIDTGEKITQAQEDLEEAEAKAEQQYADMKIRIKYMYEDGQSDAWEALLTATDFTDFINKAEYASSVHAYDRQKLEELKETQQEIADLKETLETEQANLEEQQTEYQAQEESVNAELTAKKAEVADFDEQIQAALLPGVHRQEAHPEVPLQEAHRPEVLHREALPPGRPAETQP